MTAPETAPVLEVEGLSDECATRGGPAFAVTDVSFAVPRGRRPGLVGESGSGKTTLMRMLLGFQAPTAGAVRFGGRPAAGFSAEGRKAFRRQVQAVFQAPFEAFNPFYRIEHLPIAPLLGFGLVPSRKTALDRIAAAMAAVGLRPGMAIGT